jgi:polyisoprenoid-binding protein YceI
MRAANGQSDGGKADLLSQSLCNNAVPLTFYPTKEMIMIGKLSTVSSACLLSFSVLAADSYTIDSRHTFPSFEISHLGFSTQRGRFNETSGKVTLDAAAAKGSIDISVNTATISTGLAELEEHLRGKDFFDSTQYPAMTFKSDKLSFQGEKLVSADGVLTLRGISKPVSLHVEHFYCGMNVIRLKYTCGADAVGTIKRSAFGIDKYAPAVGDEVKLLIQVEAVKD